MKARNEVIAGDYVGKSILALPRREINIILESHFFSPNVKLPINRQSVKKITLVDKGTGGQRVSGIDLGGLLSGRMKGGNGIYRYSVEFRDGKKSLIEVDEKCHVRLLEKFYY